MNKDEIRSLVLEKRGRLAQNDVQSASQAIVDRIKSLDVFKESRMIMSYMPYGQEVDMMPLNRYILEAGKRLCLPRVLNSTEMDCAEVKSFEEHMVKSRFGILEPSLELPSVDPKSIDLILVPGLAFDREGNRIGHGKGYYDRFLAQIDGKTFTLGIAYGFQVFEYIPNEPYDKKVRGIMTERQLLLME